MLTCNVCPRLCRLEEGQTGFCNIRKNVDGENVDSLYGLFYPNPEEHNPPGSYTIVFPGCGLRCPFCIVPFVSSGFNGDVSQWPGGAYRKLTPREVVQRVKKSAGPERGGFKCGLMGLFGGEAAIHIEYVLEAARLCHEAGCASKIHSSGFLSEDTMRKIAGAVNVVSVNVKGSCSPSAYQRMGAKRDVILRSIDVAWNTPRVDGRRRHTDGTLIQNLVGPGLEATEEEVRRFGEWLVEKTDPFIRVVIEPMFKPTDHFVDSRVVTGEPVAGDEVRALLGCWSAGEILFDCGLYNVWAGVDGRFHVPTAQPAFEVAKKVVHASDARKKPESGRGY